MTFPCLTVAPIYFLFPIHFFLNRLGTDASESSARGSSRSGTNSHNALHGESGRRLNSPRHGPHTPGVGARVFNLRALSRGRSKRRDFDTHPSMPRSLQGRQSRRWRQQSRDSVGVNADNDKEFIIEYGVFPSFHGRRFHMDNTSLVLIWMRSTCGND